MVETGNSSRSEASRNSAEKRKPSRVVITQETYDKLFTEREMLKANLVDATKNIAEYRISDDNPDHSAKMSALNNAAQITARMRHIEEVLYSPIIMSPRQTTNDVGRGNTVEVSWKNEKSEADELITLVGSKEDTFTRPRWYHLDSQFGQAIHGKKKGDSFDVVIEDKKRNESFVTHYTVLQIFPGQFAPPRVTKAS